MAGEALAAVAAQLEGLEETIIHRIIDRAQFATNPEAYEAGTSGFTGDPPPLESLFHLRLRAQEEMDAAFGRYHVPEERPFHRDLPAARRTVSVPPSDLVISDLETINLTAMIAERWLAWLPRFCPSGSDGQYGSAVEHDVAAIQAIGRRVHFGALHVGERKYQADPERISDLAHLAAAGDREPLLDAITRREVERAIEQRVAQKTEEIQQSYTSGVRRRIDRTAVANLFLTVIIPLTKEGEIRYLIQRAGVVGA